MKKQFLKNQDTEGSSDLKGNLGLSPDSANDTDGPAAETLFASSSDEKPKKRRTGMVKAQKIMIISFVCIAVVLSVLYFAWLKPKKDKLTEEQTEQPPALLAGEAYSDNGNAIVMFPHTEIKNIVSVEVHNSYGSFSFLQDEEDKESFYIKEHPLKPIDSDALNTFLVDAGYTVIDRRVSESSDSFSLYGLADEDNPSYYILKDSSGNTRKIYIGKELPSGSGYYARYDGRNVVYVMASSTLASTLLSPATALISPLLGYPMDETTVKKLENVLMYKNGQPFVSIHYTDDPTDDEYAISAYEMLYPGKYIVNDDNYALIMLASLAQLKGYTVLAAGGENNKLIDNEAIMAEYGFFDVKNPPYEIYYHMEGILPTVIAFAPSGVDGYYFAYSYLYDTIVLVETENVEYLDWNLLEFVNDSVFAEYISDVSEISVSGKLTYKGKEYDIKERFSISYEDKLNCYAYSTGKRFIGDTPEVNFIQGFYGTALRLKLGGYIKSEGVDIDEITKTEYAAMTVKMANGEITEYKFYRYSNRCYYTVNGEGEFYISVTLVNKLLVDAVRAAHGSYVDSEAEYADLPESFLNSYK